jgi:hypothetical protein
MEGVKEMKRNFVRGVKTTICSLLVASALLVFAAQAHATPITIDPSSSSLVITGADLPPGTIVPSTKTSLIVDYIENTYATIELYKSDAAGTDPQSEDGDLIDSYTTVFNTVVSSDPDHDLSTADITYDVGDIVSNGYLLVKDGNNVPIWYLFDLGVTGLMWDGKMKLELRDFWLGNGSISHVSLFGKRITPPSTPPSPAIPEPTTVVLFGLGLAGLVGMGIKKRRKKQV